MSQSTDTPKGPASQRGERAKERVTRELGFEVNPGKKSLTWTGNEESTFGWKVDIADDSDIRLWLLALRYAEKLEEMAELLAPGNHYSVTEMESVLDKIHALVQEEGK